MKKVLIPLMVVAAITTCTQVVAESLIVNDFNDGTTHGWKKGDDATDHLTTASEAGNGYLRFISQGPDIDGVKDVRIAFLSGKKWRGNYVASGAKSITARIKVIDAPHDLEMHVAFGNTLADLRTRFSSAGVIVPNDGEWHDVAFSLTNGMHQVSIGGHGKSSAAFSLKETLGNVHDVRFTQGKFGEVYLERRGGFEGYTAGEAIKAEVWFDDITLSTDEVAATAAPVSKQIACIDDTCDSIESREEEDEDEDELF